MPVFPTVTFLLLILCSDMTSSANVSIVLLENVCSTSEQIVVDFINSRNDLDLNATFVTFCSDDGLELEALFSNQSVDFFLGAMDYRYNTMVFKYADLNQRPLITPYGTPRHVYHSQYGVMSFGASFESISVALRLILTNLKWSKLVILAEVEEYLVSLATAMFVELTHASFEPKIHYIAGASNNTTLDLVLDNIKPENKGKKHQY